MPPDLRLVVTADGSHTLFSKSYGCTYHSIHGALQESRHIFLEAGLGHFCCQSPKNPVHVLETGFGTGLNALLCLIYANRTGRKIQYLALEKHFIGTELARQLNYPELTDYPGSAEHFLRMHAQTPGVQEDFDPCFSMQLESVDFRDFDYGKDVFDLVFFDPFDYQTQPDLWEAGLLEKLYESLRPDGLLVTYGAKGIFKRSLKQVGFRVEGLPGPPGKREITRAVKP